MMVEIGVPPALADAVDSLKESISAGRTGIFKKLLEACETCEGGGVDERRQLVNSLSTEDGTFLHMATKLGRGDIIRALLAAGADPGVQDSEGNTPLQVSPSPAITAIFTEELLRATARSEIGRVCQLIAAGLNVNTYDNPLSKNTPLHWAASFANLDTIGCLIARGADVNSCNSDGATPLHDAVARSDPIIVEALLEQGANPLIQCHRGRHKGKTPYEMALKKKELQDLVERYVDKAMELPSSVNGNVNGSVSPVLARRALLQRGLSGSAESLTSIGADSVMTNTAEAPSGKRHPNALNDSVMENGDQPVYKRPSPMHKSVSADSIQADMGRCALESSSSLDLSPKMEQVCERLAAAQLTTPPRPLVTNASLHKLWPQPKRITELSGPRWIPPPLATLGIVKGHTPVHRIVDVWDIHKLWLREAGCELQLGCVLNVTESSNSHCTFICIVDENILQSRSHYTLLVNHDGVRLLCGSLEALHHALVTLVQLLRVFASKGGLDDCLEVMNGGGVPPLVINDFPSLPNRGFLLDAGPLARVPTLECLFHIVDSLLLLKFNQLHLLMHLSVSGVTPAGSSTSASNKPICTCYLPYQPRELVSLERHCKDRGVSLVPGFELEVSSVTVPMSCMSEAIGSALKHFPSARHIHLGPGLTSFLADSSSALASLPLSGIGSSASSVFTGMNLSAWEQLSIPHSVALHICANVFHGNPGALAKLNPSVVLVEYGFQADYDFTPGAKMAHEGGRPLALCPGTAAWNSLSGWPEAAVSNVYSGILSGIENGACSLLVAHWSNTSSLTPLSFAWPPLFVASGLSWNHFTHWDFVHSSLGSLIDMHLIRVPDCSVGAALIEMGRCETWITRVARGQAFTDPSDLPSSNQGSLLHQLLSEPDAVVVDNLSVEVFASVMKQVRKAVRDGVRAAQMVGSSVAQVVSSSPWPLVSLCVMELHLSMDMILTACRLGRALVTIGTNPRSNMGIAVVNPGVANLPATLRTDLANKVLALREVYGCVWMQGNQPHGLQASLLVLTSLLARLLPEQTLHGV